MKNVVSVVLSFTFAAWSFLTSYLPRNIYVYPSIQFTQHLYPYIKQCLFISHEGKLRQNFLMLNFSPPNLNRPQSSSFLSIWPASYLSIYLYIYFYFHIHQIYLDLVYLCKAVFLPSIFRCIDFYFVILRFSFWSIDLVIFGTIVTRGPITSHPEDNGINGWDSDLEKGWIIWLMLDKRDPSNWSLEATIIIILTLLGKYGGQLQLNNLAK